MQPEAAAAQMAVMEDSMAVAVLAKLNPRVSSAILNEMDAGKAAKLTDLMSGLAGATVDRKKS
jgi:flagellar motility protein MotE (MotC chaperone)